MNRHLIALFAGPLLFLLIALLPAPEGMSVVAKLTAGITVWMAIWWIMEPINTAVTSLLPLVLFPFCGQPLSGLSGEYGNELIFLFLAGFFFGKTIERWNLHRRIALRLVLWLGHNPSRTVLGFMVSTGFISMWISNTATAVMMTPVAIAVGVNARYAGPNFNKCLMLGVGYACSIGGLATMIGTPTNGIFLTFVQKKMGMTVSFLQWFLFGFPFACVLLIICWWLLLWMFPLPKNTENDPSLHESIKADLAAMGPMTAPESRLLWVFGGVITAWVSGSLLWYNWVNTWVFQQVVKGTGDIIPRYCNDTVVAVAGGVLLFLVPTGQRQNRADDVPDALLDWNTALKVPWGVVLFFGGGLALAKGFDQSGLALWMGEQMKSLNTLPHVLIILSVLTVVVLLSEVASNIATASMMMPVLAALAVSIGVPPFGLLLSATMAASFGFGLPIATAPNTIVFSSGQISTRDMAKAGFLLDAIAILLLLLFIYILLPVVWGFRV